MDNRCTALTRPLKQAIAYHGWGFDASCWHDWQTRFEQQGWQFTAFDRGYWRQPVAPTFAPTAQTRLLLVHSYGLHLCPIHQLQQANTLVIFSSFARFHPASAALNRRSQKMLQQMIDRFAVNPQQVLSQFWVKCYHPCAWTGNLSAGFDRDLLLHDLQNLQTATIDLALLKAIPQILILQGCQDRIICSESSDELATQLLVDDLEHDLDSALDNKLENIKRNKTANRHYQRMKTAGHALPFTHLDCCWSKLPAALASGTSYEY